MRNEQTNTWIFESPRELAGEFRKVFPQIDRYKFSSTDFYGSSPGQVIKTAKEGDSSRLGEAQALRERIRVAPLASAVQMVPAVMGGVPIIGDYLGGEPECMRTLEFHASASAPLTIAVDLTSSAMISAKDLVKRGVSILALVDYLSAVRPVELIAYSAMQGREVPILPGSRAQIIGTRLSYTGDSQAQTVNALTNPGFCRLLCYDLGNAYGMAGDWARFAGVEWGHTTSEGYIESCRAMLGLNSEAFIIPAISVLDKITTNPDEWLVEALAACGVAGHE